MIVQDLSYDLCNPVFDAYGLSFSVQVFTFENVYALDAALCSVSQIDGAVQVKAHGLAWAGGQEHATGCVSVTARRIGAAVQFALHAEAPTAIRSVKLVLHSVPPGIIINLRETPSLAVPLKGVVLKYPDGWRGLYTPLVITQSEGGVHTYYRSLDTNVRDKKFAFVWRGGRLDAELIFEELATRMGMHVDVPVWEVGTASDARALMSEHQSFIEQTYNLQRWETRPDVPAWLRKISLVAAIHCQHYSGYIFNDYAAALEKARWLAGRIAPERVLIYLPGWEGRYYWQYGDYRPDARMGGEAGFERMVTGMQELGMRVMPMFGANVVNSGLANFEQWGVSAVSTSPAGMTGSGSVDWDGSRHHDHGWGLFLNVGAPSWQNRLVDQISALVSRYGFDAAFLDISAGWMNDPHFEMYPGMAQLAARLRERNPGLLVAGEGWYDAVGAATPLMQNGHTEGVMHPHDTPFPAFFDTYHRAFGHLCLGDPSRGSTGVHELGVNPAWREPRRKGIIPTLTVVEDSLEAAPERVEAILDDARQYARDFLR
jgi:hypothetical protein